jgi:hypothetical protein
MQRPSTPTVSVENDTAMTAAERSGFSGGGGTTSSFLKADDGNWRKPGKMYRTRLVAQDEAEGGGKSFRISNQCAVERYFQVADKVQYQFLNHPVDTKDEFVEAYLVGTRLCKFLSRVLPTHKNYFSNNPHIMQLRGASQAQLAELLPYLDQLERVIDEDEHQLYISQVLGQDDEVIVGDDDDWEDVTEEEEVLMQQQQQLQQQPQQPTEKHQEAQKDISCVNTTITSYEWTPNHLSNTSLDMNLILDSNSLVDSFTQEEVPDPQPQAQTTRRPPLQSLSRDLRAQQPQAQAQTTARTPPLSSLRPPPHHPHRLPPPPPPSKQTPHPSSSPSLRTSSTLSSSRNLESSSQRTAAAVSWDTAWQRTSLHQSSLKQKQQQPQQQPKYAPVILQDSDWLQEPVRDLSPVRPLRVLQDEPHQEEQHHRQQQQHEPNISLVAVASMDHDDELSLSQGLARQQEHRSRSTAAVTSESKAANAWAHAPDDEYHADYPPDGHDVQPTSSRAVDEWNLPYSATSPDRISVESSSTDTDEITSKWTMNLSMASSAFHPEQAATPPPNMAASSTPEQVSPLPPRISAKNKNRERRRRTVTPMTKLPPVKESSPSSFRSSRESPLSDKMRAEEEDFVDHVATAFCDEDTDLLLESRIEKRWQRAARKSARNKGGNHSFTTLREGSPKSIIDMDNWKDDSGQDPSRNVQEAGKRPLLLNKKEYSDVNGETMNVPPIAATSFRKQDSFGRRLGEDPDDSESLADNRALTRRGRAMQPFKSCVKCLLD